jgi:hypothetical protein
MCVWMHICECGFHCLSHWEMLRVIIFWNSFHQPSHICEYSSIFIIFRRWECKNIVRWNQLVGVPGIVYSPHPTHFLSVSSSVTSQESGYLTRSVRGHIFIRWRSLVQVKTWWLTTNKVKWSWSSVRHTSIWGSRGLVSVIPSCGTQWIGEISFMLQLLHP